MILNQLLPFITRLVGPIPRLITQFLSYRNDFANMKAHDHQVNGGGHNQESIARWNLKVGFL